MDVGGGSTGSSQMETIDKEQVFEWILDLSDSSKREQALLELRYFSPVFSLTLWWALIGHKC
ncbi:unnamed protein product [Brugia timori]|uniref:Ovule protein n=1 Tax=Brugia timori TaxID=42155 RepID=A0A0R3QKA5_9BILA|nr:unnamed protein product [Brugia timori]